MNNTFFKRDIFVLTTGVVNTLYVKLSSIPLISSISIILDSNNSLTTSQFDLIQINDENVSQYPDTEIGDYILSWSGELLIDTLALLRTNIDKKLQVQYVTENTDSSTIQQVDYTDWDNSVRMYPESMLIQESTEEIELQNYPIENSLFVFANGYYFSKDKDYTIEGKTITFTNTIQPATYLSFVYMY